ncbi:hypothetical protein IC575_005034 [Cucumis melo]
MVNPPSSLEIAKSGSSKGVTGISIFKKQFYLSLIQRKIPTKERKSIRHFSQKHVERSIKLSQKHLWYQICLISESLIIFNIFLRRSAMDDSTFMNLNYVLTTKNHSNKFIVVD